MTEGSNTPNLINLPKFGSFWSRPEGKLGYGVLAVLGVVALGALYVFGPVLLAIAWTTTKLVALCGGLLGGWFLVSNKTVRNLASNAFAALMERAVRAFVKVDPYGVVRRYVKYLRGRIDQMGTSIAAVMGQNQSLMQLITTQTEEAKKFNGMLKLARQKRGDNDSYVKTTAVRVGRLDKSTALLQKEWDRNKRVIEVLKKLRENATFVVDDTESAIELQIRTHSAVSASHAAFADAVAAINGDKDKKEMFDASMTYMAEDVATKIGQIEMGFESIQGALTSKEFENDAAAAEVLRSLDETERQADQIRVPKAESKPVAKPEIEYVAADGRTGAISDFEQLLKH